MKSANLIFRLRNLLVFLPLYGLLEWLSFSGILVLDPSLRMSLRYLLSGLALGYAIRKASLTHWIFVAMLLGMQGLYQ